MAMKEKRRCQNVGVWNPYPTRFIEGTCPNVATRVSRMGMDLTWYCEKHYQYWIEFFKSIAWKKR